MNRKQIIGMKIREKRKELGLTRVALGRHLDRTPEAIKKWEAGLSMPLFTVRPDILRVLKIKSKTFFKGV
jgi:transcriptional regulator with XRE-family HTH domain